MLTINSEHQYSDIHFESIFKDNISTFDQNFEKQKVELKDFKEEHHDELKKFSSGPI